MKRILTCLIACGFLLLSVHSQVSFTKKNTVGMQSDEAYSEVLDFNNDGYFDIVYCDMLQNSVKVLINSPTGDFNLLKGITVTIPSMLYTNILVGDFDNDLYTDFMITFRDSEWQDFVKVYKNINGTDFVLFFEENITNYPINAYEEGAVFWDFDNDNDLDIISRNNIYSYSNGCYDHVIADSWPRILFSDSQFRNPLSYGKLTVKNNGIITDINNIYWTYTLNLAVDTLWDISVSKDKTAYDATIRSSMYLELGGDAQTDQIWVSLEDDCYNFKYATTSGKTSAIKLFDIAEKDSLKLLRWDVADVNGDKVLDIVYVKSVIAGSDEVWLAELKYNEEEILVLDKHYKIISTSSKYSSLKLVDIDNDHDIDIVHSKDIYLNDTTFVPDDGNGKLYDLSSEYRADLGKYNLEWTDSSRNKSELLRYEVLIFQDKLELQNLVNVKNQARSARFPVAATGQLVNSCLKGVNKGGWHYWTVRSINSSIRGSEWAELDSFYVEKQRIQGALRPCMNSSCIYTLNHDYKNVTHVEWEVYSREGEFVIRHNFNYLMADFLSTGEYVVSANVFSNNEFIDSVGITLNVRPTPKIELDGPKYACAGTNVVIKNIANNVTDSINYHWFVNIPGGFEELGYGLDSISVIMPEDRFAITATVLTVEDDKYCAFNPTIFNVQEFTSDKIANDFIAPEVICGSFNAEVKLSDFKDPDSKYYWNVDGAEIVNNQFDTLLHLSWEEGVSKEVSLYVEKWGCISDTNKVVIKWKAYPKLSLDIESLNCHGQEIPLVFTGISSSESVFDWDFDGAEIKQGQGAGPYQLQWNTGGIKELGLSVNDGGCMSDTSFTTEISDSPDTPELCGLSVSADNDAVIYWQVPQSENVDSIYIYRESVQANLYEKLAGFGRVEAVSMIDTATDCSSRAYRYKISVLDTCGFETALSAYHKSLHLMLNKGQSGSWNLIWSAYEGLDVGTYTIYRGSDKDNMMKIADISGNMYSFTDQYPPLGDLYYAIAVSNTQSCTSTLKSSSMDAFVIQSNIVETSVFNGISDLMFDKLYSIGTEKRTLNIFTNEQDAYDIELLDIKGRSIFKQKGLIGNFSREMSGVTSGIYFAKMDLLNGSKVRKVTFR